MQNQGKDEFNELLKLLSIAQRAIDCNFDTSRVRKIFRVLVFVLLLSLQLHPKDRAPILHECLFCSREFDNLPALSVNMIFTHS